ncbi:hypothetical protein IAD21_04601 [Abditibacteriota bacterium]|nr:hypothetical protein IAD21_04601 [Abditibacteriota bacterium]
MANPSCPRKQPKLGVNTPEIPFIDEDYFYHDHTPVALKQGWNQILVKARAITPRGNGTLPVFPLKS